MRQMYTTQKGKMVPAKTTEQLGSCRSKSKEMLMHSRKDRAVG